jgi:thymidine phosphorylase
MFDGETVHVLDLIRRLRTLPSGDEERALCEFLRRVKEHRLPSTVASALACAIAESGILLATKRFSPISSVHSTGAPGSLSTLLAPVLVAACGVHVPLVSVPGSVAGAIDSLGALPGYNDSLAMEDFLRVLEATKLAHIGHAEQIAPADKILWTLRERTGTKEQPVVIAASLLGKKLATGAVCGSIDVRVGPAGNAGATPQAALETAWMIVSAARTLGMRISCVLSDATRLPWPRVGRFDALLSLEEILSDGRWLEHPHVKLCREVATLACHAADPLTGLEVWRERVAATLRTGRALAAFEASVAAQGAQRDGLEQVRRRAAARRNVLLPLRGEPEPGSLSAFFKAVRKGAPPGTGDALGVTWREEDRTLAVHVPIEAGLNDPAIRRLAASLQPLPTGVASIPSASLLFDGQIRPLAS